MEYTLVILIWPLFRKKKEAHVCVTCITVIIIKYILIICADLIELRKKYFDNLLRFTCSGHTSFDDPFWRSTECLKVTHLYKALLPVVAVSSQGN